MRQCLFCDKTASTKEHMWSLWILKGLKKTKEPIYQTLGKGARRLLQNAEVKIRCVCEACNNGWMSDLENMVKPVIEPLMHNVSTPLDPVQQLTIVQWAVKTAMVIERVKPGGEHSCCDLSQCRQLRLSLSIPDKTYVWLGRLSFQALHANAADFVVTLSKVKGHGCVANVILGHLLIQVVSIHLPEQYAGTPFSIPTKAGLWGGLLVQIWPTSKGAVWPPALTFTNSGEFPIATLLHRFRSGAAL